MKTLILHIFILISVFSISAYEFEGKHTTTQGINDSASYRDCPSYLASAETVRDLLLFAETTVNEKLLPFRDCPCDSASCRHSRRKLNHKDSLCRKRFTTHNSLCRKLFTKHNGLGRKQESRRKPNMTYSL